MRCGTGREATDTALSYRRGAPAVNRPRCARNRGSLRGDLRRVPCVDRNERGIFHPAVASVVQHHATPRALAAGHADDFTDDRGRATFTAKFGIVAERFGVSNHGEMTSRES